MVVPEEASKSISEKTTFTMPLTYTVSAGGVLMNFTTEKPQTFGWAVDGQEQTLTVPNGAKPGEEHEFSYVADDGGTRFFKATIPKIAIANAFVQVPWEPCVKGALPLEGMSELGPHFEWSYRISVAKGEDPIMMIAMLVCADMAKKQNLGMHSAASTGGFSVSISPLKIGLAVVGSLL